MKMMRIIIITAMYSFVIVTIPITIIMVVLMIIMATIAKDQAIR